MRSRNQQLRPVWRFFAPVGSEFVTLATNSGDVTEVPAFGLYAIRDAVEREDGQLAILQGEQILCGPDPLQLVPREIDPGWVRDISQLAWLGRQLLLAGRNGLFSLSEGGQTERLRETSISGLWSDHAGRVWVGGHGLTCLHFAGEVELPVPPAAGKVDFVHLGADGRLYVVFEHRGLTQVDEELTVCEPVPGLDIAGVTAVDVQADHTIHATFSRGTRSIGRHGLVIRRPNGTFDRAHVFDAAEQIVRLADDRLLVAAGPRIWTHHKRRWSEEKPVWAGPPSVGYRLRPGRLGCWWVITNTGLGQWIPDRSLTQGAPTKELASELIHAQRMPIDASAGELGLLPVLRIGWADGRFDRKERAELLRQLGELGYGPQTPLFRLALLTTKLCPSPAFFDDTRRLVVEMLSQLSPEAQSAQAAKILSLATAMADASGGFLGLGNRICREERDLIEELASALANPSA